jgi:hypothetical protein
MATELTVQSERAFQKQPHIFLNHKSKAKSSKVGKGGRRWYKDVGLGFRTPKTAIEGNYIGRSIFGDQRSTNIEVPCPREHGGVDSQESSLERVKEPKTLRFRTSR